MPERDGVPREANWIKACHECQLDQIWIALKRRIGEDISEWTQTFEQEVGMSLKTHELPDGGFVVVKEGFSAKRWVSFFKKGEALAVRKNGSEILFTLQPKVGSDGRCHLYREDEQLELWQVSKILLEDVIFWVQY